MPISVVTGGSGFLGSHLTDRLLKEGHEVVAVDSLLTGNERNLDHLRTEKKFRFLRHDVTKFIVWRDPWTTSFILLLPPAPLII